MIISMSAFSASADPDSNYNNYMTYEYGIDGSNAIARTYNRQDISRFMTATLKVYRDYDNSYYTSFGGSATGYNTIHAEASAPLSVYSTSQYHFNSSGSIYNGPSQYSGWLSSWGPKSFG